MKVKSIVIFIIMVSTGCAYFNIYYNANTYYNEALKEKEKNPTGNLYKIKADEFKSNYGLAIKAPFINIDKDDDGIQDSGENIVFRTTRIFRE